MYFLELGADLPETWVPSHFAPSHGLLFPVLAADRWGALSALTWEERDKAELGQASPEFTLGKHFSNDHCVYTQH